MTPCRRRRTRPGPSRICRRPHQAAPCLPERTARSKIGRRIRNQPETESAPAPQMMEAPPPTAWIPAAQEDLLAGYDRNTGDGGEPFWLLTAEEYSALLEALAERDAAPMPDSPPAEEVTEEIRICLREV